MRLSINDKRYPPIKFNNKINLPEKINDKNMLMFTDIEKKDFGKLTISMVATSRSSMTDKNSDDMMKAWSKYWAEIGH